MPLTRRSAIFAAGGALVSLKSNAGDGDRASEQPYSDRAVTDAWIVEWMNKPRASNLTLNLGRFADAIYFLRAPANWAPNPGQEALPKVDVPIGFVTDFASIPRIFWTALPKDDVYTYPAIIHDYLYWEQPITRENADKVLLHSMDDFKVAAWARDAIYAGVRAGGASAWNDNASRKAAGERRILKVYPTDPTVRWDEWRIRPGVFG